MESESVLHVARGDGLLVASGKQEKKKKKKKKKRNKNDDGAKKVSNSNETDEGPPIKKRKLHDNEKTVDQGADVDNEGSNGAAKNNPISGNTCLLFVRNLPFDADERSIGEFFLPGIMKRMKRSTNAKTGRLVGSSFVEMSNAAAASEAVAKSGQWLQGRRITVEFAPQCCPDEVFWPPSPAAASCGGGRGENVLLDEIAATGVDALAAKVDEMVRKTELNKVIADFERRTAAMEA